MTKRNLLSAVEEVKECDLYIPRQAKEGISTTSTKGQKKNQKEGSKKDQKEGKKKDQKEDKKRTQYDARVLKCGPPVILADAFLKCHQSKKN